MRPLYFLLTKDGQVPTQDAIDIIFNKLMNENDIDKLKIRYRMGIQTNSPELLSKRISNIKGEWGVIYITADGFHVLNYIQKELFIKMINNQNNYHRLSGELAEEAVEN